VPRRVLYSKIGWRLLPILFLGYVVNNLIRNNVAVAKLAFVPALGFSQAVFGLGASLFYVGYVLFEIPSNLLLMRIGARLTFLRIMILWAIFSFGLALMNQPWHYYVLRALLGAAEAGFLPGVLVYLSAWAPRARRARFTALFMASIPISGLIGGPLAGVLMHGLDGAAGIAGWRWLFAVEALPAFALAALFFRGIVDKPAHASWLTPAERSAIEADVAADDADAAGPPRRSARASLADPATYLIGVQALASLCTLNGLILWGPSILKAAGGGDVLRVGLLSALPQFVGVFALLGNAELSDRRSERLWHTVVPSLLAAAAWLLLPVFHGQLVAVVILMMAVAAGVFGATATFWSIPSHYLRGPDAAAGVALITTLGAIGAMMGAAVVGWLADRTGSLAAGQYFYCATSLVGVAALLIGVRLLRRRITQPA